MPKPTKLPIRSLLAINQCTVSATILLAKMYLSVTHINLQIINHFPLTAVALARNAQSYNVVNQNALSCQSTTPCLEKGEMKKLVLIITIGKCDNSVYVFMLQCLL